MATLTITDYLKYANLQMAAEAFLVRDDGTVKSDIVSALTDGNFHASRFTPTQAKDFVDPVKGWTVVDQCPNTSTGFSGTLFKNNQTGELVLSFRSTEFIDDSARDNQATNTQEIKELGFAFGQISDMEAWFKTLQARSEVAGKQISVTGYSLGGHLATAFHILHANDTVGANTPLIKEVVTFNGAGIGTVNPETTLAAVMHQPGRLE